MWNKDQFDQAERHWEERRMLDDDKDFCDECGEEFEGWELFNGVCELCDERLEDDSEDLCAEE